MTFLLNRSRPVRRRTHWEQEERQQFLVTVGFLGLVVLALLILGGAVGFGYYNDHLKPLVTVNGRGLTADDVRERVKIARFRESRDEGRVRDALAQGFITPEAAQVQLGALAAAKDVDTGAVEDLVDETLIEQAAAEQGLAVADQEVESRLLSEGGSAERRSVQAVFVRPADRSEAKEKAKVKAEAKAKAKAEKALAELQSGASFGDVARTYSDHPSKDTAGEYGTIDRSAAADEAWLDAVFALPEGGTTGLVEGADGVFRIGRVTRILPAQPDPNFLSVVGDEVNIAAYRRAVRADLLRERLADKIVAEATDGPVEQVHASEIFIHGVGEDASVGEQGDAKVSHILYSPNDDPQAAQALDPADPAWAAAQKLADAAVAKLRPVTDLGIREEQFRELARSESDDKGSGANGGELGTITPNTQFVQPFLDAVFAEEHKTGEVLGPVKTDFGYHVILLDRRNPPPARRIADIRVLLEAPSADFAAIARAESDADTADDGGDLGWIAPLQLEPDVEKILFALAAGQVSETVERDDGFRVYRVAERATRPPDPDQAATIRAQGFEHWLTVRRDAASIVRDESAADVAAPSDPEQLPEP